MRCEFMFTVPSQRCVLEMGHADLHDRGNTQYGSTQYDVGDLRHDPVTRPAHYTHGDIEVWDAIANWKLDFMLGNVVKYVARAAHKGVELEDLKKARAYLEKKIRLIEGGT